MTGVNASKLAIAAFIIPYIFVLSPVLLMIDATAFGLVFSTVTAIMGMVGVSSAMIGYLSDNCTPLERIILFFAGLMMIVPGVETDIPGMIVFIAVLLLQKRRRKGKENIK